MCEQVERKRELSHGGKKDKFKCIWPAFRFPHLLTHAPPNLNPFVVDLINQIIIITSIMMYNESESIIDQNPPRLSRPFHSHLTGRTRACCALGKRRFRRAKMSRLIGLQAHSWKFTANSHNCIGTSDLSEISIPTRLDYASTPIEFFLLPILTHLTFGNFGLCCPDCLIECGPHGCEPIRTGEKGKNIRY